ncbi:MAG: PAS domain-containing protein, partial [Deltaproteobacteria bacterium]|nr:PAS domain-containing protein [Deltaproteobacteria bacterium]
MNEQERTHPELAEENILLKLRIQELERVALAHVQTEITKRTQSEKALRASEQKFRGLIESIPVGVFIYEGTQIRYLNPACEKITGYTRSELYLHDIWDLVHPEFKETVREYVLKRQRKESVPELHAVKIVTKDAQKVP